MTVTDSFKIDLNNAIEKADILRQNCEILMDTISESEDSHTESYLDEKNDPKSRSTEILNALQAEIFNKKIILDNLEHQERKYHTAVYFTAGGFSDIAYAILRGIRDWLLEFAVEAPKASEEYFNALNSMSENVCGDTGVEKEKLIQKILDLEPDFGYSAETTHCVFEFLHLMDNVPVEEEHLDDKEYSQMIINQIQIELDNLTDFVTINMGQNPYTEGNTFYGLVKNPNSTKTAFLNALLSKVN